MGIRSRVSKSTLADAHFANATFDGFLRTKKSLGRYLQQIAEEISDRYNAKTSTVRPSFGTCVRYW